MKQPIAIFSMFLALSSCKEQKEEETPKPAPARQEEEAAPNWEKAIRFAFRFDENDKAVVAEIELEPGFHAYTTGEEIGRPLKLEFLSDSELVPSAGVSYPAGTVKELDVGKSVIVEGKTEIRAPVQAVDGSNVQNKSAKGTFFYQVCTQTACDRPRSAPFTVKAP